jgi:hypothetical protein
MKGKLKGKRRLVKSRLNEAVKYLYISLKYQFIQRNDKRNQEKGYPNVI